MIWLVLGLLCVVVVLAVIAWTQQNELTHQSNRLDDLEQGRPVTIEDGPARLARNRQDR